MNRGEEEIKTAKAASHSLLQMAHKAKDIGAIPLTVRAMLCYDFSTRIICKRSDGESTW